MTKILFFLLCVTFSNAKFPDNGVGGLIKAKDKPPRTEPANVARYLVHNAGNGF